MTQNTRALPWVAAIGAVGLGLAACSGVDRRHHGARRRRGLQRARRSAGGTLNMLGAGDVDYMDPNISYYSIGYLGLRLWSRQLFTYPAADRPDDARPCPTSPPRCRPPATGHQQRRPDLHHHDPAGREVEHLAGPPGDRGRHGARRQAHLQPGRSRSAACRTSRPDRRATKTFCDGFAKVGSTAAAIADYIEQDRPARGRRQGRPHRRVQADAPGHATSPTCSP